MHNIIRLIYLGYFFTHIPITILLDLQGVLPSSIYDALGVSNFFIWYHTTFDDHLMGAPPIWLKSFLFSEMVFQLPFFFVAVDALRKKKCSDLVKTLFIVYATVSKYRHRRALLSTVEYRGLPDLSARFWSSGPPVFWLSLIEPPFHNKTAPPPAPVFATASQGHVATTQFRRTAICHRRPAFRRFSSWPISRYLAFFAALFCNSNLASSRFFFFWCSCVLWA